MTKRKADKTFVAPTTITNCQFTSEPYVINADLAQAVTALARAMEAAAKALQPPADSRTMITIEQPT